VSRETKLGDCPNFLQLRPARRGIAAPSKLLRLQSCKAGITAQEEPAGNNTGFSRENILLEIRNTDRSFSAALRGSDQLQPSQQNQQQFSGKNTHQTQIKQQVSQCRLKM
jgi:hypothetical protein